MARSLVLVLLSLGLALSAGCGHTVAPQLRVLGVNEGERGGPSEAPRRDVVFVQVSNPARRTMRLTKLAYTFAAEGAKLSEGEVVLAREVPAGEVVVVEIPLERSGQAPVTLSGKLTAELDHIVEIFSVSARITPNR